jgi:hypothetical protein
MRQKKGADRKKECLLILSLLVGFLLLVYLLAIAYENLVVYIGWFSRDKKVELRIVFMWQSSLTGKLEYNTKQADRRPIEHLYT